MDWDSVWSLLHALAESIDVFMQKEWDVTKLLQALAACVTIVGGTFGIIQAWRFAEKRLADGLRSYLRREEERLEGARQQLIGTIKKTSPGRPKVEPVYSSRELDKALRQLRWGRTEHAEQSLASALKLIDEKVGVAEGFVASHRRQKAAAHLLLGAIADTKGDHVKALGHFEEVLKIEPDDLEALEYAGLQVMRVPDPTLALSYFQRLETQAHFRNDAVLGAKSRVLQARAYYAIPHLSNANSMLVEVVKSLPPGMSLFEKASIHELHGDVRKENGFMNAHASYVEALTLYRQASEMDQTASADAKQAFGRVSVKIATLNDEAVSPALQSCGLGRDTSPGSDASVRTLAS